MCTGYRLLGDFIISPRDSIRLLSGEQEQDSGEWLFCQLQVSSLTCAVLSDQGTEDKEEESFCVIQSNAFARSRNSFSGVKVE